MICFDTTVFVDLMRGRKNRWQRRAHDLITELLEQNIPITTTRITEAELFAGAMGSTDPAGELQRVRNALAITRVLDFDAGASVAYARLHRALRVKGETVGAMDLLIAAIAKSQNAMVLTRNPRDFVKIEDLLVATY